MHLIVVGYTILATILLLFAVWCLCKTQKYKSVIAAGPWHEINRDGTPIEGIPVLTRYVSPSIGYYGFRVDTYSTKQGKWMEADVWDQEVIAYAEIKPVKKEG
jgi:hypothetical protein